MNNMKTSTSSPRLRKIAKDVMESAIDFPSEDRGEVLDALIEIAAVDHELTDADVAVIHTMIWARS
jgi:uncharacterized tellurite resistance protein B-like protein